MLAGRLTFINRLFHYLSLGTFGRDGRALRFEGLAGVATAASIERFLQDAVFPTEDVVAVLAVTRPIKSVLSRSITMMETYPSPIE